ncbi:hypothetical protein BG262_05870 [Floricoccus penangensis]|uniref:CBU-0592-like domain-containing protein n=1 Tax=Floricoccus penangensis TaxID=1859475 RepID=A0A9Q5JFD7_9LACT|nr:hypothetical protein [Floricoccus penangensis]OFI46010.1 hypothetical protein BG262_05870 [Floricoccus penangensis]
MFIQIFGSMLVLVSFLLVQAKKLTPDSQIYLLLNSIGSGLLAFDALRDAQWGFLLLEGCWAVVSIIGLIRSLKKS